MTQFVAMDDDPGSFASIVSHELATLFQQNIEYLQKSLPVGKIAAIMVNIPGVPDLDPNVWQICDGSEILNPNSPLRSLGTNRRYTPDMTDRYIKVGASSGLSGNMAGSNASSAFAHTHEVSVHESPATVHFSHDVVDTSSNHTHQTPVDIDGTVDFNPPFYTVQFFLKIQ